MLDDPIRHLAEQGFHFEAPCIASTLFRHFGSTAAIKIAKKTFCRLRKDEQNVRSKAFDLENRVSTKKRPNHRQTGHFASEKRVRTSLGTQSERSKFSAFQDRVVRRFKWVAIVHLMLESLLRLIFSLYVESMQI